MFVFSQEIDTIDTIQSVSDVYRQDTTMKTPSTVQAAGREYGANKGVLRRCIAWLSWRATIRRSRIALLDLSEEQLRDIGLQRSEAEKEARKARFHLR